MPINKKHQLGKSGEELCTQDLINKGYEIITRNFRSPYGEIDIIAREKHYLVFVEVKTRTKESLDDTKWNISISKQRKITRTAMYFLIDFQTKDLLEFRFDVMILKKEKDNIEINHLVNAFLPPETGDFFA